VAKDQIGVSTKKRGPERELYLDWFMATYAMFLMTPFK
jgi:hypothetical protein